MMHLHPLFSIFVEPVWTNRLEGGGGDHINEPPLSLTRLSRYQSEPCIFIPTQENKSIKYNEQMSSTSDPRQSIICECKLAIIIPNGNKQYLANTLTMPFDVTIYCPLIIFESLTFLEFTKSFSFTPTCSLLWKRGPYSIRKSTHHVFTVGDCDWSKGANRGR